MKTYSKEEIDELISEGKTGNFYLVVHTQDLIKLVHAVAYNAQAGTANNLQPLSDSWKTAVDKHLIKVFGTYLKQKKIEVIKSREEDA